MPKIGFEFPLDNSQQWDGFNEPGIEHFAGSPFRSLGREATQNTLDAKTSSPARIRIRRVEVATKSIPDVQGLKHTIALCDAGGVAEGDKAAQFFSNAKTLLEKPKTTVLQIADYNTRGVAGPCQNGTPYFALMKASGQSKKDSATATGSFGIGKFAPYTVSNLRTVFLTTVWKDDISGKEIQYVQGKAILMSHQNGSAVHRGTGFWGIKNNCLPVVDDGAEIPDWLDRNVTSEDGLGTTLSILGFNPAKNWDRILAASIAESFFGAIDKGELEVEIEDGPTLTSTSLEDFFSDSDVIKSLSDEKDEPESFISGGQFLKALRSTESKIEETENAGLGHCRIHILVGENLPKKVAILRNGMLITANLERLRRFSEFKEFVAVVECLSEKGNALLRAMEPPAHDDFEPARIADHKVQRAARVALAEIAKWVREMLQRHAQDPVKEVTEIDELAEFFGDEEGAGGGSADSDVNPQGAIKIRARPLPKKKTSAASQKSGDAKGDGAEGTHEGDGDGAGTGEHDGGDGSGGGSEGGDGGGGGGGQHQDGEGSESGKGGGSGAGSTTTPKPVAVRNFRGVVLSPSKRRLAFTPGSTGQVELQLEDSGADTNRPLEIVGSSIGSLTNGKVHVACTSGKRITLDVELSQTFAGTLRIKANAI